MMRRLVASSRVRFATGLLAASVAALTWSITLAVRVRPDVSRPVTLVPIRVAAIGRADTTTDELVEDAIERDPFSPTRERPSVRYGSPPAPVILNKAPVPVAVLRLVGTVVDPDGGSFVVCQLGDAGARTLRVGQRVGDYELRTITQGAATFVTRDGNRLELRVPKNGS
jgi:hypothetical protein